MRKLISIKMQYIFTFIPLLNTLVIFMYLFNIHKSPDSIKLFSKSIFPFFVSAIIPTLIFTILEKKFINLSLISLIEIYLIPLFISLSLINFQKKNMDFRDRNKKTGDGSNTRDGFVS